MMMAEIIPIVMNSSFQKLAAIDYYTSFIWSTRYYSVGDFELCVDVNQENISLLQKDYYILRDDDEHIGIIEDILIQRNEDGQELLIVSGRFLSAILARRIIAVQTTVTGTVSACVNTLINQNIVNPSITARKISNFIIGSHSITDTMQAQYTGKNLLDTVSDIASTYGIGFKTTLNSSNQFVFQLFKGIDRTYDQTVNPWVIFSDKYDNLLTSEYEENYKDIATAVLVAGEGDGLDRKTVWVTDGSTGLARHEVYKDQRQLQSDNGTISDAEYTKLMQEEGKESLTKYTSAFTGTVYFDNVKFREDINIGDLCVIENSKWGIYLNTRLVEVIESVNEAGEYSIVPTFGV